MPGASFPPITLTVRVSSTAPPSLTNRATVFTGTEPETSLGNNIASDITTIGPGPDLAINKSHTGNFLQGQTGAIYTITVSNPGTTLATGVVTVTDNVPAGLVPTSAAGDGWTCNISGQDMTCTRSDPLATVQSYPPITLMVNVQPGAPESVTNAVTVSGGGDVNPANNSDTDVTAIIPGAGADLTITKSHAGNLNQGQIGATYTVTARNIGMGATTGTVTVVDNFPPALIPTAAGGSGWTCGISTNSATCTRTDSLAAGGSYPPITLTVNVASTAPPSVDNSAVVTGGNDGNSANNTVTDPTTIIGGPDLTITKTANGSFTQGQTGAGYTLTVSNTGGVATSGTVTVIDNLPTGLSPATISGPGWSCGISGNTATCTRSDASGSGSELPADCPDGQRGEQCAAVGDEHGNGRRRRGPQRCQ